MIFPVPLAIAAVLLAVAACNELDVNGISTPTSGPLPLRTNVPGVAPPCQECLKPSPPVHTSVHKMAEKQPQVDDILLSQLFHEGRTQPPCWLDPIAFPITYGTARGEMTISPKVEQYAIPTRRSCGVNSPVIINASLAAIIAPRVLSSPLGRLGIPFVMNTGAPIEASTEIQSLPAPAPASESAASPTR
ncbi:hypothetical protein [Shumkonia mesophila]|uniref:hypothetical protein n=1 Tax=Shumkonia mesophila TaxID=2838854 RepID=UPI0029347206|nr:hypothetical protein [Shumkonia mesophila]